MLVWGWPIWQAARRTGKEEVEKPRSRLTRQASSQQNDQTHMKSTILKQEGFLRVRVYGIRVYDLRGLALNVWEFEVWAFPNTARQPELQDKGFALQGVCRGGNGWFWVHRVVHAIAIAHDLPTCGLTFIWGYIGVI